MTQAPERIWAWKQRVQDGRWIGSICTSKPGGQTQEYVRADLCAALEAQLADAQARTVTVQEAARVLLDECDGVMPVSAKLAAVKVHVARDNKTQPVAVIEAFFAALYRIAQEDTQ